MNAVPRRPVPRVAAAALGAWAGATAWVSLGVVAVVDADRLTRVVALPSATWLAGLVAAGMVAGAARAWPRAVIAPLSLLVLPWLPWAPFPIPVSWLLWDGPLEGAVWMVAIGGLAVLAWRQRLAPDAPPRSPSDSASRHAGLAALVMAVVALTAWAVARPRVPSGDEPHYLVIAQSLLRDGDLQIENNHRDGQYLDYYDGTLKPDFMRRGIDRQIYSIHAPGTAAVVLPAFAAAGYGGAVMTVVLIGAAGLAGLWLAAFRLTRRAAAAWVSVATLATAAPCVLLAFTIYPDPAGSAVVALTLLALVTLDAGGAWSGRAWVGTGAALALLPWLHTRFAVTAGLAGLALALRAWQAGGRAAVARFLVVPTVSAAAWFGYFRIIYGTLDPGAPYGTSSGAGLAFVPQGLVGLLVDQQFGLVATAPAFAAGLVGLGGLAVQRPRLALELAAMALPYLTVAAAYPMWWGGFSSPARFAVCIAPVLALPSGWLWMRSGPTGRSAIVAALAISAGLTVATIGVDRGAFVYNGRDGHSLVLDWLSPLVDLTLAAPSVHRAGPTGALASTGVWAAAVVVVLLLTARSTGVRRALGWLAAPLVVMTAVSLAGAREPRPLVTPPTSATRALGAWRTGDLPIAAQLGPARWLDGAEVAGRLRIVSSTRGEPGSAAPLLQVVHLPAGDYDVFLDADGEPAGTATVRVGRQGREGLPLVSWHLEDRRAGYSGLQLRLPVGARTLAITGDDAARRSLRAIALSPRPGSPAGARREALRAARYGHVEVFALDDATYLEPGAFWTRAEREARVVVRPDDGTRAVVRLKAGPVPNDVRLSAGTWTTTVPLAPGATADVPLPAEALAPGILAIEAARGFRPSASGGDDVRWLGVYVTWPDVPATP